MHTLLGHLAFCRLTNQVEDLATEALGYLLRQSEAARGALKRHVARCGRPIPDHLSYATQSVGEDEARPDLVGRTLDGAEPFVIEAKFWAGLTEHQPITYLQRLPPGGVLLFVVPEARLISCWNDLLVRCTQSGLTLSVVDVPGKDMRAAALDGSKMLALTSWRRLLEDVHHATRDADQLQLAQDVVQLQGLCDQQDQDAFLPIRDEELAGSQFRRIFEFARLPEDALKVLESRGMAKRAGPGSRQGMGLAFKGNYFLLRGVSVYLAFDLSYWVRHGMTPIWLTVPGESSARNLRAGVFAAMEALRSMSPPRLFENPSGFAILPILLPVGVERDRVLSSIVEQVERIGERIAHLGTPAESAAASQQPSPAANEPDSTDALS